MAELQVGQTAPDVELPTDAGGHLSLKDLAGKPVVLYFYPQDDTETCTAEAIDFSRAETPNSAKLARPLSAFPPTASRSMANSGRNTAWRSTLPPTRSSRRSKLMASGTEKSMFGRKYMGVERATFLIGRDGSIARIWRKVRVTGHADDVLAAVKAL